MVPNPVLRNMRIFREQVFEFKGMEAFMRAHKPKEYQQPSHPKHFTSFDGPVRHTPARPARGTLFRPGASP
jgi:hypothetical protein